MLRKLLFLFLFLILLVFGGTVFAWVFRASLAAHFLSKAIGGRVVIEHLDLSQKGALFEDFLVQSPGRSKEPIAFAAQTIAVVTTPKQVFADRVEIDLIAAKNLFVGIEKYGNGETNWKTMLASTHRTPPPSRPYLIRTLILENLTVEVVSSDGSRKRYPTIERMEFHNISDETGFPLREIQKAIFNEMMKEVMQKFNIDQLLQPLLPGGSGALP